MRVVIGVPGLVRYPPVCCPSAEMKTRRLRLLFNLRDVGNSTVDVEKCFIDDFHEEVASVLHAMELLCMKVTLMAPFSRGLKQS